MLTSSFSSRSCFAFARVAELILLEPRECLCNFVGAKIQFCFASCDFVLFESWFVGAIVNSSSRYARARGVLFCSIQRSIFTSTVFCLFLVEFVHQITKKILLARASHSIDCIQPRFFSRSALRVASAPSSTLRSGCEKNSEFSSCLPSREPLL